MPSVPYRGSIEYKPDCIEYAMPIESYPEWTVTVKLISEDGRLVVSEMAIRPGQPGRRGPLPAHGLTSRLLREIRLGEIVEEAHKRIQEKAARKVWVSIDEEPLSEEQSMSMAATIHSAAAASRQGPGRVARDDVFYAAWAALWHDKLASGSRRPRAELAEEHPEIGGEAQVRDVVHEARRRGFLRKLRPDEMGLAVGGLTDKARAVLGGQETE